MEMLNAKRKIDYKTIALLVVSVLLVISLTLAGTMAWFTAQDQATGQLTMGAAITMTIDDKGKGDGHFKIEVSGTHLLPGSKIAPDISMDFEASTTASLLRVSFAVTGSNATVNTGLLSAIEEKVTAELGWIKVGNYFYYIGNAGQSNVYLMNKTSEGTEVVSGTSTKTSLVGAEYMAVTTRADASGDTTVLASILPETATKIVFLNPATQFIRIPTSWTDTQVAGATVTITVIAEALQDQLVNGDAVVAPTIASWVTINPTIE